MRFVVLACLSLCPQERNEERGSFALYRGGRAVGREDWRIEEFGDGRSGVFARTKLAGKVETANDTVLTLDRDGRALLFAGIATTAGATLETRLEIKGGRALCEVKAAGAETKREARFGRGTFVVDPDSFVHAAVVARAYDASKGGTQPVRVFSVRALAEMDGAVEDRGAVRLRSGSKSIDARLRTVAIGRSEWRVYLAGARVLAVVDASQGVTAYAPDVEGWEFAAVDASRPGDVEESDVSFAGVAGTFARPRGGGRVPAVVIVSGFGPQDRDGNDVAAKARGTASEMFVDPPSAAGVQRSIAHALAAAGVASLRYDDRGVGKSGGDFAKATLADVIADARAGVEHLRGRAEVGAVGIVGHGEGGLAALAVAARDERVKAVFLLGTPARSLDGVFLAQAARELKSSGLSAEEVERQLAKQRREFEAIEDPWLREHFAFDPLRELASVKGAVVAMQGLKDDTVLAENAGLYEKAMEGRPNGEVKRYEGLGHRFIGVKGRLDEEVGQFLGRRAAEYLK